MARAARARTSARASARASARTSRARAAVAAVNAASAAVNAAARAAAASDAAAYAAYAAGDAGAAVYAAYKDADFEAATMLRQPLWHDAGCPENLDPATLGPSLLDDPDFDFLKRWFEGMVRGEPLDSDLMTRIALEIDQEVWDSGDAKRVAQEIATIEADWIAGRLPQAEEIVRDAADGRYEVRAVAFDPDEMLAGILRQLRFQLEMALRGHNHSGFSDMCVAYRYVEHTLDHCADDPNAVHMHLRLAREDIEAGLESGAYAQEGGLRALVTAMERHEVQLRADHPVVRRAHDSFVQQRLREMEDAARREMAQDLREIGDDHAKGRLAEEYALDADMLAQGKGVAAQADALKRAGGRSAKMAQDMQAREREPGSISIPLPRFLGRLSKLM